jgi:hypothetical protein
MNKREGGIEPLERVRHSWDRRDRGVTGPRRFAGAGRERPLVDSTAMSAGRIAMWLISGLIVVATVAVLAGPGYDGVPGHWIGLVVAASFVAISFALGLYE